MVSTENSVFAMVVPNSTQRIERKKGEKIGYAMDQLEPGKNESAEMNKPGSKTKYLTTSGNVPQTRFWDKRELARYLKLSIYTIDAWVSQRKIPFFKIGGRKVMFDKDEIEKWIANWRVEPNPVDEIS